MNSYQLFADYYITDEKLADMYVLYMMERWSDTEKQKCYDGYAKEWINRFLNGIAYQMSDGVGRAILNRLGYSE